MLARMLQGCHQRICTPLGRFTALFILAANKSADFSCYIRPLSKLRNLVKFAANDWRGPEFTAGK